MKTFLLVFLALFASASLVNAAEVREIELTDGSVITGEIVSLSGGVYTIRSAAIGTVQVEESKVRTIRVKGSSSTTGDNSGQLKSLQEKALIKNRFLILLPDEHFSRIFQNLTTCLTQ